MRLRFRDVVLYTLAGLIIVGGAFGMVDAVMAPSPGVRTPVSTGLGAIILNPLAGVERLNILLMGSDDRVVLSGKFERGRSDTIMVLSLSPRTKRVAMMSLPRDLLVTIPEVPKGIQAYPQKINHAYAFGGVKLAQRTIERELGMKFDYYAKIDLKNFVKVVDMLGGVDLEVPDYEGGGRGMNYDDDWGQLHIHLKPGYQHLDGKQAMGFVRYRKSKYHTAKGGWIGLTDSERAGNQQIFLKAIVEQKVKVSNLPNLMRAAAFTMQHVDTDMDWRTAVGLANLLRGLDTSRVLHLTVPVRDRMIGGIYYCEATPEKLAEMRSELDAFLAGATDTPRFNLTPGFKQGTTAATARPVRVRVLNGSGTPGAAKRAADLLQGKFVHLDTVGNADRYDYEQSTVEYLQGQEAAAQRLAVALGLPGAQLQEVAPDPSAPGVDMTVIIGRDFLSVTKTAAPAGKAGWSSRARR
jgi:LCP family protein required for cell wall assembly